jgi:mono/diheme cytochrome c family protein
MPNQNRTSLKTRLRGSLATAFLALVATAGPLAAAPPVAAAQLGSVETGRQYVQDVCSSCHAIKPGAEVSPVPEAPTFEQVANTPGMNERALMVFFRTPHASMPNLVITGDDADNVVAYIMSLKEKK